MVRRLVAFSLISCLRLAGVASFLPPQPPVHISAQPIAGALPSNDASMGFDAASRIKLLPSNRRNRPSLTIYAQPVDAAEEKELTPATIAEMVEVSFLNSCLQLSQGYIDVLKLFIVAVKAGYERGMPLTELHQLVDECPVNSAGRDLMKEEKELRHEWMRVVYEMLNALNTDAGVDASGVDGLDSKVANARISEVVEAMLSIKDVLQSEEETTGGKEDASVALTKLTVETALERSEVLSKLNDSTSDPVEKAFLTNDIRVALVTFRALNEESICMQDSSGTKSSGSVPRPPIPGTG